MSNQHQNHQASGNPPPPQNPIPNAQINLNPHLGRVGPVRTFPGAPHNRDGLPALDQTSQPAALNLHKLKPVRGPGAKSVKANEGTSTTGQTSEATADDDDDDDDDDDEAEEADEDDDSDFELVEAPVYTPSNSPPPSSPEQAYETTSVLTAKIPPELVPPILDYAEYFPHSIIGSNDAEESIGNNPGHKVFITAQIPEFEAADEGTAGKGGDESVGRPNRVRRLVFKFASRDQGWSSNRNFHGSYVGAYSWLEVELWRRPAPSLASNNEGTSSNAPVELEKVDSSILQRNKHASSEWKEYEIVWDWQEDELDDANPEKWEQGSEAGWYRDGRIKSNGRFLREIRGGDEIRVIMRAQFPGWRCMARSGSVECFWAV